MNITRDEIIHVEEILPSKKEIEKAEEKAIKIAAPAEEVPKKETATPLVKVLEDIFFDYDRFYIKDNTRRILEKNAEYLKSDKAINIIIEGHCDEKGDRGIQYLTG